MHRIIAFAFLLSLTETSAQTIALPDSGWHLWPDTAATWEHDSLYLPDEASLASLEIHPPTGGWDALDKQPGIVVSLPTTVEEHYWGAFGFRKYEEEYAYETEDTVVRNGNYRGVSWWWRSVDVPAAFKGKITVLYIRGARLRAEVFVNRKLVGYNIITETSFTCDISAALLPGSRNTIALRITNPGGRLDWIDTQTMPWGTTGKQFHKSHGFGGLDRGLRLDAHDSVYVTDIWGLNTPDPRTISVHVAATNATGKPVRGLLRLDILDPHRKDAAIATRNFSVTMDPGSKKQFESTLSVPGANLWSDRTPVLYKVRATLTSNGPKRSQWSDARTATIGFRSFEADGIGSHAVLRLNGERLRLTSAISWGFWGYNGLWPTPELATREVLAAKALGLNCLQFHRNTGRAEVFDAQDRLGLMRFMEPGGGQTSLGDTFSLYAPSPMGFIDDSGNGGEPRTFSERYMEEKIIRTVLDHRSHPSLLIYCIQNEIHPDLRNPRIFHMLRRIHQEDPSRIVVLKSGFPSGSHPINQAWMAPYSTLVRHDTGNGFSGWWDDHTVGGPGVWRDEMYRGATDFTHRSENESEIVMWGEMLGAAVADNHSAMVRQLKAHGGKSYDLDDHVAALKGYETFLDRWGFRSAFPTSDALFTSIGNKSYDFWGRVVETARLSDQNDFFVISGWESTAIENHSGLVDNLRNFKGDPSLLRRGLEPLRAVIRSSSLVYRPGDSAMVDLYLLNETGKPHARKMRLFVDSPDGAQRQVGIFPVPRDERDKFVYHIATRVAIQLPAEGAYVLRAELENSPASTGGKERLLTVGLPDTSGLPHSIGMITSNPELRSPFELFPGVLVRPYIHGQKYDALIAADRFVRPPATAAEPGTVIESTDDDELYRAINYGEPGSLEFIIPGLPAGPARVTLKFAELFQNGPGLRVFDVAINGTVVLSDFDVFREAGGKNIACDRTFTVVAPEGIVHITFPRVPKPSARICAVRIEAGDSVVSIRCGGPAYTDKAGATWRPYEPPDPISREALREVSVNGTPLLVLSEGEAATDKFGRQLASAGAFRHIGTLGDARASWMGSWYFVRDHPAYAGLPVNCAFDSYYQVPVTNASGLLIEGDGVEVFAGYSRDHDRNVAAASLSARIGKGKVIMHSIPGVVSGLRGAPAGMHPVMLRRLLGNSLKMLFSENGISR